MAWFPFVAYFFGPLNRYRKRNNKRGLVKRSGKYKKYRYDKYQVGRNKPRQYYFGSFNAYRKYNDRDPDYSDTSIVDKKGNTTRIPWWADDRE